jgi:hypothetical protein
MGPFLKAHASFVNGHADAVATFDRLAVRLPEVQRIASDALLDARSRGQNIQSLLSHRCNAFRGTCCCSSRCSRALPKRIRTTRSLVSAVALVRGIASELNEAKRNHDDAKLMFAIALHIDPPVDDLIEPHRRLLLDAVLHDVSRDKPYRFVLFSDLLLKLSAKKNVFVGQQGQAQSQGDLLAAARASSSRLRDAASTFTIDFVDDKNNRKVTSLTLRPESEQQRLRVGQHAAKRLQALSRARPKSSQYRELPQFAPFDRKNPLTLRGVIRKQAPSTVAAAVPTMAAMRTNMHRIAHSNGGCDCRRMWWQQ